ncbi:hypothetical protein BASA81_015073 [Batrachochytrium salamandrivorans]|nr:hypothetical protein BASA81_015073 [Batrachochytrium salamandrivorans]
MLSFAVRRLRQAWLPRVLPRLWAARPTVATAALAPIDRFRRNVAKPLDSDFQPVHARFGVLRPLKSLGGLSLVCYMAIEATEGHFQLYRTWRADVAQDLARALDRVEELELLVQDLTTFVERQKDQIQLLRV